MTSAENEEQDIMCELRNVSMKMQQLVEHKKMLCIMKELKKRVNDDPTDDIYDENKQELKRTEEKLNQLEAIRVELQKRLNDSQDFIIQNSRGIQKPNIGSSPEISTPQVFFVEPPPHYPAPEVIFDPKSLDFKPSNTQCPECSEFITTKTSTHVSSITWLACMITAMMGCVAGCCFLPFCLDSFKSTSHKCPKCNSLISTVKKL